ncbi:MAG: hypothetical protein WCY19_03590 [Candidatus Gastranaerophilaceae bacterium]
MRNDGSISIDELLEETRLKDPEAYNQIMAEVERRRVLFESGRGGARKNAGRKKEYEERVKETFNLEKADVVFLKDYAKKQKISKNKALQEAIKTLKMQA